MLYLLSGDSSFGRKAGKSGFNYPKFHVHIVKFLMKHCYQYQVIQLFDWLRKEIFVNNNNMPTPDNTAQDDMDDNDDDDYYAKLDKPDTNFEEENTPAVENQGPPAAPPQLMSGRETLTHVAGSSSSLGAIGAAPPGTMVSQSHVPLAPVMFTSLRDPLVPTMSPSSIMYYGHVPQDLNSLPIYLQPDFPCDHHINIQSSPSSVLSYVTYLPAGLELLVGPPHAPSLPMSISGQIPNQMITTCSPPVTALGMQVSAKCHPLPSTHGNLHPHIPAPITPAVTHIASLHHSSHLSYPLHGPTPGPTEASISIPPAVNVVQQDQVDDLAQVASHLNVGTKKQKKAGRPPAPTSRSNPAPAPTRQSSCLRGGVKG